MNERAIHINRPRNVVVISRDDPEDKWCFSCRRRLAHQWVTKHDDSRHGLWYDPWSLWECAGCGGDFTTFPGSERD